MGNTSDHADRPVEAIADDVAALTEQFPGWFFCSVWAAAASGPDRRLLVGQRNGVTVSAWNVPGMREQIAREERASS